MKLSEDAQIILLQAARESISSLFDKQPVTSPDFNTFPELKKHVGAFVTLTIYEELRGCIGYIKAEQPLFNIVCEAAKQAAIADPRFSPLREKELTDISIEISVLSEFEKIKSYDEIIIGKHGLLLEEGGRGLLLPQVAVDHKMDRDEFLSAVCRKSGLYSEYWKEKMLDIKVFSAQVFGED